MLCYNSIKPFLVFLVSGALFTVIGFILSIFLPVFYVLFTMFHPGYGKPNAGSGLGVLISFHLNADIYSNFNNRSYQDHDQEQDSK